MALSRRQVARYAADRLAEGANSQKIARLLAAYIADTRAERSVELLLNEIKYFLADGHGHMSVDITSTHSLDTALRRQVEALVGPYKTLEVREVMNNDMLGGLIIDTPSKEFDGSIKTRINKLKAIGS